MMMMKKKEKNDKSDEDDVCMKDAEEVCTSAWNVMTPMMTILIMVVVCYIPLYSFPIFVVKNIAGKCVVWIIIGYFIIMTVVHYFSTMFKGRLLRKRGISSIRSGIPPRKAEYFPDNIDEISQKDLIHTMTQLVNSSNSDKTKNKGNCRKNKNKNKKDSKSKDDNELYSCYEVSVAEHGGRVIYYKNYNECPKCHRLRLARAHHCKICNMCYIGFDHHCPWVGGCVAIHNHANFLVFLLYATIVEVISGIFGLSVIGIKVSKMLESSANSQVEEEEDLNENIDEDVDISFFIIDCLSTIVSIIMAIFTCPLLVDHWEYVANNETTVEHMENKERKKQRAKHNLGMKHINRYDLGSKRSNFMDVFGPKYALKMLIPRPITPPWKLDRWTFIKEEVEERWINSDFENGTGF